MFEEFDDHLEECLKSIYDGNFSFQASVPTELTRAVSSLRRKEKPSDIDEAKVLIKNEQDVKDGFWGKVEEYDYSISVNAKNILHQLLSIE